MFPGEWRAILYQNNKKINEQKFNLVQNDIFLPMYEDYRSKRFAKEQEMAAKQRETHPAQRGGKPTSIWQIKKGLTKKAIENRWGAPDKIFEINDTQTLWIYWTPGSENAYSGSKVAGFAAGGNIVGALIYAAISHTVDSMLAAGKIVIIYFKNGIVKGARFKDTVFYADLKDLELKRLKYILQGLPISKQDLQ